MNATRQRAPQTKFLRQFSCFDSGGHLPKRGNTTTSHLHHHCVTIEGGDNCRTAESHVPVPLLTDGVIGVAGTERASYLTKNAVVTGSMMVHVPWEESNAAGINPVGNPIHDDGRLLPPWSTIGTTCDVDHLTTKTNHNVQSHNLTTKGMLIAIAATIGSNNANNINGKAVRMIGRHG
jgi:hypothetical protein